jgi:serine/threonine-protein kinase mTOR
VDRGLEWLHSDQSSRRLAACFVLKELAENAPTLFFVKTSEFFDRIWIVLRDPKPIIRINAARCVRPRPPTTKCAPALTLSSSPHHHHHHHHHTTHTRPHTHTHHRALSACLQILAQRNTVAHVNWYCKIYEQVQEGLSKGQAASIHGSLLIVGEMLSHTGDFMVPRFQEVCQAVMSVREHKDRCIRLSVIEISPRLAQFCSDMFARVYLEDCLAHLVSATRHSELRPHAFLALGAWELSTR